MPINYEQEINALKARVAALEAQVATINTKLDVIPANIAKAVEDNTEITEIIRDEREG